MALQIRAKNYCGRDGFLICGKDPIGRRIRIFTLTRLSAEIIRDKARQGQEITVSDFQALPGKFWHGLTELQAEASR